MDLRSEAIYALQQPYIRLQSAPLMNHKKFVKKVLKEESRHLGAATVYRLDNAMLDIIIPSLKQQRVRQFLTAFWTARPPHKNFYLEWDHYYLCQKIEELYHLNKHYPAMTEMVCGIHSRYCPARSVSAMNYEKGYDVIPCRMPPGQEHSFYVKTNAPHHEKVVLSPKQLMVFDLETTDEWFENRYAEAEHSLEAGMFRAGPKLWSNWLDIPEEELGDYDGLEALAYSAIPTLKAGFSTNAGKPDQTIDPLEGFVGVEQLAFRVFIAAVSLLNFDWVTIEQEGITDRGTKSVNTRFNTPVTQYKTITINLPKDKAIAEFHKQKLRTRKFGTAEHTVRGHWRVYKKSGERVWIGEHKRGDEKYGTVHKDYVLTKRDDYLKPTVKRNDDARQRPSRIS